MSQSMSQCPRMSQCPTHHPHALPARDDDSSSSSSMDEDHAARAARAANAGAPAPAAAAPSHAAEMPSNALAAWAHHPPSWSLSTLFHVSLVLFVSTVSTVSQCHRIDRCPCPHVHVPCPKCIHVHVQCPHRAIPDVQSADRCPCRHMSMSHVQMSPCPCPMSTQGHS